MAVSRSSSRRAISPRSEGSNARSAAGPRHRPSASSSAFSASCGPRPSSRASRSSDSNRNVELLARLGTGPGAAPRWPRVRGRFEASRCVWSVPRAVSGAPLPHGVDQLVRRDGLVHVQEQVREDQPLFGTSDGDRAVAIGSREWSPGADSASPNGTPGGLGGYPRSRFVRRGHALEDAAASLQGACKGSGRQTSSEVARRLQSARGLHEVGSTLAPCTVIRVQDTPHVGQPEPDGDERRTR